MCPNSWYEIFTSSSSNWTLQTLLPADVYIVQAQKQNVLQVDTFETVKDNVYDLLGDLAQDFNNEQLDILFSKFEDCNVRPVSNAMKVMDLMRRLAKHDTKVSLTAATCWLPEISNCTPVGNQHIEKQCN